jgi:hypothetical protein
VASFKVPPLHIELGSASMQGSTAAAAIHRAYSRLVWRRETVDALPRYRVLLRAVLWPSRAVYLSCAQIRRHGKWVRARFQKSRAQQFKEMLSLAIRQSIPPRAYTVFELYKADHYAHAQSYLHRYETKRSLFDYINRCSGGDPTVVKDKIAFARRCHSEGLPSPATLVYAKAGEFHADSPPESVLADRDIMIKPAQGKGGRGIERWDAIGKDHHRDPSGLELSTAELVSRIRDLSRDTPILVQPRLGNHPDIADLGGEVLVTARIMTGHSEVGASEVLSAVFRVAVDNETVDNFHQGGLAAAVDLETGRLGPAIGIDVRSEWHDVNPRNGAAIAGRVLPDWAAALELVQKAHGAMGELVFLVWDVAFTPDGPVLVEANHDPDVNILQRPHKRPLGGTRFAELLAYHLADIESRTKRERSIRKRFRRIIKNTPLLSSLTGLREEREVDAFVVSFPKCGRTWLRVQLGRVMQQHFGLDTEDLLELTDMARRSPAIPHVRFLHADRPQQKAAHELSAARVDYFRFRKVILVVRDPRDVVVSMFMQRTKRGMKPRFDGTLSEFIHEPVGGFDTLLEFYNLWAERQGLGSRLLVVRYEDMHEDPARVLRRVLDFLNLRDVSEESVTDAVSFSSFDRMKQMEREDRMNNSKLRPGNAADADSFKVRKGQIGGYLNYLTDTEIASLEQRMTKSLRAYYQVD